MALCILVGFVACAQSNRAGLDLENVSLQNGTLIYEQRLYRNPFRGFVHAGQKLLDTISVRRYVPLIQGVPIGSYSTDTAFRAHLLTATERLALLPKIRFPLQRNYWFDLWIQPVFTAKFGNIRFPVRSNTSILLQSQLYLWRGMSFNWGVLLPLTNDLDNRPQIVRPAPLFLNQFYASGSHFVSGSVGLFHNDQYGVNLQYRRTNFQTAWSYGLELGLTGLYYYPRGGLYYEKMDRLLALADVEYRFQKIDLILKATAGQFLYGDKGIRFDFIRQFTNVEIGLFAIATQNGSTAGFNFAIPIPPGKIVQTRGFRLRTGEEFRWEYLYAGGFRIGERYQTGYQLDQRLRQYHQWYLNRQFRK